MMSIFEGEITDLSFKGFGVTKAPDGVSVFVQGSWPGDFGRFRVIERKKRYSFAVIEELLKPSPARRSVPCPHQGFSEGDCGGCPWMMIDYPEQLHRKNLIVESQLSRSGLIDDGGVLKPIIASAASLGYRNRVKIRTDGENMGFHSSASNTFVPIDDCIILNDEVRSKLKNLKPLLSSI